MGSKDLKAFTDMTEGNYPDFELRSVSGDKDQSTFQLVLIPKAGNRIMKMAVDQALETIRNRIDQFGVSEPDIRPQQDNRILIQLPGVKDPKRAG
jgi:preprotein translocase subunit SecD